MVRYGGMENSHFLERKFSLSREQGACGYLPSLAGRGGPNQSAGPSVDQGCGPTHRQISLTGPPGRLHFGGRKAPIARPLQPRRIQAGDLECLFGMGRERVRDERQIGLLGPRTHSLSLGCIGPGGGPRGRLPSWAAWDHNTPFKWSTQRLRPPWQRFLRRAAHQVAP